MEEKRIEIKTVEGMPDFNEIRELIVPFWPIEFGVQTDKQSFQNTKKIISRSWTG